MLLEVDRSIGRFLAFFTINQHQPIVLQIRPINIQARQQATSDAASRGKQIAIPLAQWITLWCPPLSVNFLKRELPQPSLLPRDGSFNRLFAHDVIAVGLRFLSTADLVLQATFCCIFQSISWLFPLWTTHFRTRWKLLVFSRFGRFEHS